MRGRTFALSQKELQRVSVISSCAKGDMACARAAELLSLSIRQVKRLKKRFREQGEAALAHANRGRPSPRRLPDRVRQSALRLARTTYAGFNDHHLCEKLCEVEGFSLSREALRRLLRQAGLGSPRKRRAPAHRQRRMRSAREGELVQLDGSPHDWLEGRGPRLTALGMQDDATGKILAAQFFPSETALGYLFLLRQLLRRHGTPLAFYGDHSGIFVRNDDFWTVEEELAGKRQPTQFGRALEQLGITFIAARSPQAKGRVERLWGVLQDRLTSELRLAQARDLDSANAVLRNFLADYNRRFARRPREMPPGVRLPKISTASAASFIRAWSATTTLCSGTASASRSRSRANASASPGPKSMSIKRSMGASHSSMVTSACNTPWLRQGDIFMLPLG